MIQGSKMVGQEESKAKISKRSKRVHDLHVCLPCLHSMTIPTMIPICARYLVPATLLGAASQETKPTVD